MLWLPEVKNVRWRLPLSDLSAAVLLPAKVTCGEPAVALARGCLEQDAALSLWAAFCSAAGGQDNLNTSDALARWLAADGWRALVWPDGIHETPAEPTWHHRYRRLAAVSLEVARRARQLAGESGELAQRAYLLGLLHLAGEWSALDGERSADPASEPLPGWLSATLGDLFGDAPDRSAEAVRRVAQARQDCDATTALAHYDRLTSAGELTRAALTAAAHALARPNSAAEITESKLAAMAEFAAGAGHEINNPIAVICGRAQLLMEGETNPQRLHELAVINSQALRVFEMVSDMMLFARPAEPKLANCDVAVVVRQVIEELLPKAGEKQVAMHFEDGGHPLEAEADVTQLAVVIRALCDNALTAVARGGQISIRVGRHSATAEPYSVWLTVTDDGPGMSACVREHLFDPFFSGREAGRGLGMGLAKAWRITTLHGGKIDVQSALGEGSKFTVVLPAAGS